MQQQVPQSDTIYQNYDRSLYKITGEETFDNIMDAIGADPSANNSTMVNVPSDVIGSGQGTSNVSQAVGAYESGKQAWGDQTAGFFLGIDTDGIAKFNIGNSTKYIQWDGSNLTVLGGISVSSLNIPDTTTASSFHVDTSGNAWWGTNVATGFATAPASILATGAATFSNITITGGSISGAAVVATGVLKKGVMSWTTNIVFSSASAVQINWTSGSITLQDGTVYSISSGNTGTMSALTYIYLDIVASVTVLQTTTTYSNAVGDNKILIATAQNNTVGASVIPFGSSQPIIDGTAQISALSITAASIAASTITAGKLSVTQLSAISANLGTITAGSININSGVASIDSAGNATFKSIQVGGSTRQYTLTDSGIFSYGDGSDGVAAFDGSATPAGSSKSSNTYTLTRDVYYSTMTVSNGVDVITNGYRIFCQTSLTLGGGSSGKIHWDGKVGSIGLDGSTQSGAGGTVPVAGGGGGGALSSGYLIGSPGGANGGQGSQGNTQNAGAGGIGTNVSNSIGSSGSAGGIGGTGGNTGSPGIAGTAGTATASNVKLIANWHLATLLDIGSTGSTIKFTPNAGSGAGGGGQSASGLSSTDPGGSGGGSGSGGGMIAIYAKILIINAGASITSNGGNGGNGGQGYSRSGTLGTGGGGGGGAGPGGVIVLVYNQLTNNGSLTCAGGTGGTGGTGGAGSSTPGGNGANGSNGSGGVIFQFQLSL